MRFRERVTFQAPTEVKSPKGSVSLVYANADGLTDIPATITATQVESRRPEMTIVEDRYDIVVSGFRPEIVPEMAVLDVVGRVFDVIGTELHLSRRTTRVFARLVAV